MALTRDALIESFHSYGRRRGHWLVGGEFERHLLLPHGAPLPYFGQPGVSALLHQLIAEGWVPHREGPHPIALLRDGASVTLEPGGQYELSGAPHPSIRAVWQEAKDFTETTDRLLEGTGVRQSAMGFTPFARIRDIGWVPKGRYIIMRDHMAAAGRLGHFMMKGTAATQASYDFSDEVDCARKVKLSTALAPLVAAMFANSPYTHGRPNGWKSFRGHIWTQTDPARTGMPDAAVDFTYDHWIDYLLDVPMMFTRRGGGWAAANGQTFRQWMKEPAGAGPTWQDWDLHQTSVFPEVRVKKLIEVRMADCVGVDLAAAFVALFTGLFYCPRAYSEARALADHYTHFGTRHQRYIDSCRHGLHATIGGRPNSWWAERLMDIACRGLTACGPEDRPFLDPLIHLVSHGQCPADQLLAELGSSPTPDQLLAATHPLAT